jgi:predicted dienelactone hydrolase
MSKRKTILVIIISLIFLGLLTGLFLRKNEPVSPSGLLPEEVPYNARGPHPVGMREFVMDGETPLEISMWYPALSGNDEGQITYPYKMKMGKPLGKVSVAYSTGQAALDAAQDLPADPYPLVILSPGFSIGSTSYAWIGEHLASYGFIVVSPEHVENLDPENQLWQAAITRPQDILKVLAYIDEETKSGGLFENFVNPDMVAVIGHSYGGYTALAAAGAQIDTDSFNSQCQSAIAEDEPGAWLCEMLLPHMADMAALAGLDAIPQGLWPARADSRVDAIVSMAGDAFFFGQDGISKINIPVMAIGGTADVDSPYMWGTYPTYEYANSPRKVRIALEDAEHMIFTGPCQTIPLYLSPFSDEFCTDTSWNRTRAHEISKHFTTAFLLAELKGDPAAAAALAVDVVDFSNVGYESQGY